MIKEQNYNLKQGLPQRLARLIHENHTVKIMAALAYLVAILAVCAVLVTSGKAPTVISLDAEGHKIPTLENGTSTVSRVEDAIREYVNYRYVWTPNNQEEKLKSAENFVAPSAYSSFSKVAQDLMKFSKEKLVSQRVYITELVVDEKEGVAHVKADRFDEVQGLRAASVLDVKLFYEHGEVTAINPWAIYVNKEQEMLAR